MHALILCCVSLCWKFSMNYRMLQKGFDDNDDEQEVLFPATVYNALTQNDNIDTDISVKPHLLQQMRLTMTATTNPTLDTNDERKKDP